MKIVRWLAAGAAFLTAALAFLGSLLPRLPGFLRGRLSALGDAGVWRLWFRKTASLLVGAVLYNLFALLLVRPILGRFYPPLTAWEGMKAFFTGHHRATVNELLPYVAPALWMLGNALLFALMNRRFRQASGERRRERELPGGSPLR